MKELLMGLDEMRSEFSGLRVIYGVELEPGIYEGRLHTGKGAVVQFIAEKH